MERIERFELEQRVFYKELQFPKAKIKEIREQLTDRYYNEFFELMKRHNEFFHGNIKSSWVGMLDCFKRDLQDDLPKDSRNVLKLLTWMINKIDGIQDLEREFIDANQRFKINEFTILEKRKIKFKAFFKYRRNIRCNYNTLKFRIRQEEAEEVIR